MKPIFFATPKEFRQWLERYHQAESELLVGFYRKDSGRPSITWPESVDEALCFGWIDGIRRKIDSVSYSIRFTPRRRGSTWSAVNLGKVQELMASGRMKAAGVRAFQERDAENSGTYSFERTSMPQLSPELETSFRACPHAWRYFQAQPLGYRRMATWWVVSAKQEATRQRRLRTLIQDSQAGRRIGILRRAGRRDGGRRAGTGAKA